jgi:hypothetical protein
MRVRSRRLKIVTLPKAVIAKLFETHSPQDVFAVPRVTGLPATAEIVDVIFDGTRQSFGLVVRDKSFPVVKDHQMIPWVVLDLTYIYLAAGAPSQSAN